MQALFGEIWGLGGRDPSIQIRRICLRIKKTSKHIFGFYTFYEHVLKHIIKSSTTNHLSGFGAPGVVQNDPAYHFHHYLYGRSGYPMVFNVFLMVLYYMFIDISKK